MLTQFLLNVREAATCNTQIQVASWGTHGGAGLQDHSGTAVFDEGVGDGGVDWISPSGMMTPYKWFVRECCGAQFARAADVEWRVSVKFQNCGNI
jgi:hypothetical protein